MSESAYRDRLVAALAAANDEVDAARHLAAQPFADMNAWPQYRYAMGVANGIARAIEIHDALE
jgi:hypothetical protein